MEAGKMRLLGQLMNQQGRQFVIPVFQRNYVWETENCNQLLNDIKGILDEKVEYHFLGTIVYTDTTKGNYQECLIIDGPPSQIVPDLADQGIYIASESSIYRVLHERNLQNHRGKSKAPQKRPISTHYATGPNQVWMWDITYLPGPVRGTYYYLYLILDLFSRKVVGWDIWLEQTAPNASQLVRRAVINEKIRKSKKPLVLHSDNGSPMKGATLLSTLYELGITPSRSRPRVSNDNPYAESIFKTCKYRPDFPNDGFKDIEEARKWVFQFVQWYNYEHKHSGIKYLTPHQRHSKQGDEILNKRKEVYEQAKLKHPERWSRQIRDWDLKGVVWLNPEKENLLPEEIKKQSS
jgi:putative transposase